ncbi:hypothetical protein [Streptomyces sp. DW26H14]|uniref:hypothetical protein n=1 Tax=Streptomyces sp. DW26H14 TaxID=3435395 RepID=UPI00403D5C7C
MGETDYGRVEWDVERVRAMARAVAESGGLLTDTADVNPYMRRSNDALGYVPTHRAVTYRLDV